MQRNAKLRRSFNPATSTLSPDNVRRMDSDQEEKMGRGTAANLSDNSRRARMNRHTVGGGTNRSSGKKYDGERGSSPDMFAKKMARPRFDQELLN